VALAKEFRLAALADGIRSEPDVLADYVREIALLYDLPRDEIQSRFERFLDVYHRGTTVGSEEEWAALRSADLEHSFIRISKPYRFRHFDVLPEVLRVARRTLRTDGRRPVLLEFGGGFGSDAIVYARSGFEVHYADLIALRNTDVVRRRFELRHLDIPVHDSGDLPDTRFDVVTAIDVLEHIYDVEEATAQLAGRIRIGGLLSCVNAFQTITYDGDHHDKNRVYVELFPIHMQAAGFVRVPANPPVEVYRREREPKAALADELTELRRALYSVTSRHARQRCHELMTRLSDGPEIEWQALALGEVAASDAQASATAEEHRSLTTRARAIAARHAPASLKRAVWRRRLHQTHAELAGEGDAAVALSALADWTAVLRIAEHRLRSVPPG
jgi:hypothetical protein